MDLCCLPPFLHKLRTISTSLEEAIGGWSVDGKRYEIRNQEYFSTRILPTLFKGRLESFIRQLHAYGFRKSRNQISLDTSGSIVTYWCFFHPFFRRDKPELIYRIKRGGKFVSRVDSASSQPEESRRVNLQNVFQELMKFKASLTEGLAQVNGMLQLAESGVVLSENSSFEQLHESNILLPQVFSNETPILNLISLRNLVLKEYEKGSLN
eukprot:snap_masked-scaffold_55-processed-gene-1.13-mRNA-1 protein AED:0.35 eAED:0.35 QI:0/-1/0/1/-1/1/1/0/209